MKKVATLYFFISVIISTLLFGISTNVLTGYTIISLICIVSSSLTVFVWLGLLLVSLYQYITLPIIFYVITGFILFIVPIIQEGDFKKTVSTNFLKYSAPFYLLLSSSYLITINYFNSVFFKNFFYTFNFYNYNTGNIFFYYLFTLLLFITSGAFVPFVVFGICILTITHSPTLLIFYLLGYGLIYISKKIEKNYYIKQSNVSYEDIDTNNANTNTTNVNIQSKANTLNELISELSMLKASIMDNNIKNSINDILNTCSKINENIDISNEHKINKLLNYYAPELISILKDYIEVENTNINSEENLLFRVNVMRITDKSKEAFNKILQSIIDTTIKKTNIDIKVLEKILKDENLL